MDNEITNTIPEVTGEEVEAVIEAASEESVAENELSEMNFSEYTKMAKDMIKTLEDSLYQLKRGTISVLASDEFQLSYHVIDCILPFTKDTIDNWTHDEKVKFLNKFILKDKTPNFEEKTDDELSELLHKIKDYSLDIFKGEYDLEQVKKSSNDLIKPYVDELRKHDTNAERLNKLAELEKFADEETDDLKKANYIKVIDTLRQLINYDFVYERLETLGDSEIYRITESFLSSKDGGAYIIKRYENNIKRIKFKTDIYKHFFNIEENFLPEEYHIYNNLFLFVYMRFIAYIDVYNSKDVTFAEKLTVAIMNLVYHEFGDADDEKSFIELVKKVDDYFKPYASLFETSNTTYKNNPTRIQNDSEREAGYRAQIIVELEDMGVTDFDSEASNEELINLLATTRQNLILSQIDTETAITIDDGSTDAE